MAFKSGRGVRRKMAKVAEALVSGWSSPRTRRRRAKMSSFRPLGRLVLAQLEQRGGEDEGGGQGVRVVLAEVAAAAGQGVFVQLPGRLVLPGRTQADGQAVGGGQGVGMVLAEVAAAAGQGVFVQLPGRLVLPGRTQADGQAVGGGQGV